MNNFFNIKSIAIIGASTHPKKIGHQVLKNLIKADFEGRIYPVNLDEEKILGLKTYQTVLDIHSVIDMAVIVIPREIVPQVLTQCVHKEIPTVLIISAGFAEKDALGADLQQKLLKITHGTKTKIIGPNCLGIIDTTNKLNLTFAATEINAGRIGLILQSGAIGAAIFDWAKVNKVGISKFVSLGNKIHVNELEVMEVLGQDPDTKVIALYLEELSEPVKLMSLAREIGLNKPVIILKGGFTKQGAKAASSHTAAMSTNQELNETMYKQANMLIARDFEELLNFLSIFSSKAYDLNQNNLAVITNAGGPGILAADAAANINLKLSKPPLGLRKDLEKRLESFASLNNPFDLGGDALAEHYRVALELIEKDSFFSSIAVILTPQAMTEIEKTAQVITTFNRSKKPIICSFLGGSQITKAKKILIESHVPCYDDPAEGIGLLGKIYQYQTKRVASRGLIQLDTINYQSKLTDEEIINSYKLPYVETILIKNDGDLMGNVEEIGFPLVYKTAKEIAHKGKKHLVGLNINNHQELQQAIKSIGFPGMIQKMIESPYEIIVGARRDRVFGTVVIFGQGGIFTEESHDISTKIMPLTEKDLHEMIKSTKVWKAISNQALFDKFVDLVTTLAKIVIENQDVSEIELNPIKIIDNSLTAVDINIKRI